MEENRAVLHDIIEIKWGKKKRKKEKKRKGKEIHTDPRFYLSQINSPGQLCILFECNTITLGSQY